MTFWYIYGTGLACSFKVMVSTVMVVEDNPNQRKLYTQELSECGYRVLVVADAPAALKYITSDQARPDVVVMDLNTPGRPLLGPETLRAILRLDRSIPVIVNTSDASFRDKRSSGAAAFVLKSSDLTELKKAIRRALVKP